MLGIIPATKHLQCKKKHYVCMYIWMYIFFINVFFTICETVFCSSELADGSGLGKWDVVESALL